MEMPGPNALPEVGLLSWDEICERYSSEYVCIVDIERDASGRAVTAARVVGHGRTPDTALESAAKLDDPEAGLEVLPTSIYCHLDGNVDEDSLFLPRRYLVIDDVARAILGEPLRVVVRKG